MNKTLSIGLAGFSFVIEEHAYIKLSDYLSALRNSLDAAEADEVMHDIEIRMVEIFKDSLGKREVINDANVEKVIAQIGKPEQIEEQEEAYFSEKTAKTERNSGGNYNGQRQLFRDPSIQKIAGVCAGLAHYTGLNVTTMRAIWLGIAVLGIFTAAISTSLIVLIYIILWAVLPKAQTASDFLKMKGKPVNFDTLKAESNKIVQFANESTQRVGEIYNENKPYINQAGNGLWNVVRYVLGGLLALFGLVFLIGSFGALGAGWMDSTKIHLPGNVQFYLQDGNLQYILVAFAFLTFFIPALVSFYLALKLLTPKTKLNHTGYVLGALALIWLGLLATIGVTAVKYKSQYSGLNDQTENVSLNTTSDSILVDVKKVAVPQNFTSIGDDFFTDKKTVFEQQYPNLEVTRKEGNFQPYLVIKKYADGYNKPLSINSPLEITGNKILLPNYISYPYAEKMRDYRVKYELVVPQNKKVIGLNDEQGFSIYDGDENDNDDQSNKTVKEQAKITINGKTWNIEKDNSSDSVIINNKKYPKAVAEKMMDSMKTDIKDLKDVNISIKNGKDEIKIKTGK